MKLHEYSIETEDSFSRTRVHAVLAVFSVALVMSGRKLFIDAIGDPPDSSAVTSAFWVGAIGPLTVFGLLWNLFDKVLWRTWVGVGISKLAGCVIVPNISGSYLACTEWSTAPNLQPKRRAAQVSIRQTWSRICITLDSSGVDSHSKSVTAHLRMTEAHCELVYTYEFHAASSSELKRSGGTQYLSVSKSLDGKWEGSGFYFTENRDSGRLHLSQTLNATASSTYEYYKPDVKQPELRRPRITFQ